MAHSLTKDANGHGPDMTPDARAETAHRDGLDWDSFRDLYYPDSRRHDFEAIAAYGAYRRSRPTQAAGEPEDGHLPTRAEPFETWEDEGGSTERAA
jgi:hypothetical protein